MTRGARYLVGIDLGTTNTAVAYVDGGAAEKKVTLFEVPQLTAPGETAPRRQLPSFVYLAGEHDLSPAETALPWSAAERRVVGELARAQGARMPERMVSSAKSWLCHAGVDRAAPILPWGSDEAQKMSPIDAQAAILRHVREAWDHAHPDAAARLADQEVMVTVPASFDEAARELTLEAARRAGYGPIVLLEEPQAAFYAWIDTHPGGRAAQLGAGNRLLVFDIGGGTTDFTLIAVGADGESFERTAVGDHLLLGGDNVDLTLAKQVEHRLVEATGRRLDSLEWHGLVHACRMGKEALLNDESIDLVPVSVAGRGSRLIGGARRDQITRGELDRILLDGFFPVVERGAGPVRARGGLTELGGLPYAADAAVTRHLASFLQRHEVDRVDAVLFNGGAMTPPALRRRVIDQIAAWQPEHAPPAELSNRTPELAVAQGAAYYGLVRRGLGARIRGGTARAFYVGAASGGGRSDTAVCVAPMGLEEGEVAILARDFELVTNRPVSFRLFSSTSRDDDDPGDLVPVGDGLPDMADDDSDLLELPPIVTVLRAPGRSRVTVRIEVRITELGALEVWCRERGEAGGAPAGPWRLSFDMRSGGAARAEADAGDGAAQEAHPRIAEARALVQGSFGGTTAVKPPGLMKALEEMLGARRDEWSVATSRALFDAALEVEEDRRRSPDHEARWLNLCGFCLRPGRGAPLDEWRTRQMWRIFNLNLVHEKAEACRLAWWIVWRRIAGGLSQGQQEQIYDRLAQLFLPSVKQKKKLAEVKPTREEIGEMMRTLAHLERLTVSSKIKLGDELVRRLGEARRAREEGLAFWALGRIGARVPLYGPINTVVPPQRAGEWLTAALDMDWPDPDKAAFPMAQLGRRTGDRARDIDDELRARLSTQLRGLPGGDRLARLVDEVVALEAREERVALGDTLPAGLRLLPDDAAVSE